MGYKKQELYICDECGKEEISNTNTLGGRPSFYKLDKTGSTLSSNFCMYFCSTDCVVKCLTKSNKQPGERPCSN